MKIKKIFPFFGNAPPASIQWLNAKLHDEPYATISYAIFWSLLLCFAAPIGGILLLIVSIFRLFLLLWTERCLDPRQMKDRELAVLITGCDSGFGLDLALSLKEQGFHVFAGCLSEKSFALFESPSGESKNRPDVTPLKLDVTKDDDVENARKLIQSWINFDSTQRNAVTQSRRKRYLHALVNNAGCGVLRLVDCMDLSGFRREMEVNCFGQVRMVKAMYPIFKAQAIEGQYGHHRIVNMNSMASLVSSIGMASYNCSKFAAEAFTQSLRLEMALIGVKVVGINPSFHLTPFIGKGEQSNNDVSPAKRQEWGEDFFQSFLEVAVDLPKTVMWRPEVVKKAFTRSVCLIRPPPQMIIGSDSRFVYLVSLMLPTWFRETLKPTVWVKPRFLVKNGSKED